MSRGIDGIVIVLLCYFLLEMPPEHLLGELNWNGESQLQLFKEYSLLTQRMGQYLGQC